MRAKFHTLGKSVDVCFCKQILVVISVFFLCSAAVCSKETNYLVKQGTQAINEGKFENGIKLLENAVAHDPKNDEIYWIRVRAYLGLKQYNKAIEDALRAIELKPKESKYRVMLGVIYGCMGKYEKAIDQYNKAEKLDNVGWALYCNRSTSEIELGLWKEAIKDCNIVLKLGAAHDRCFTNRARAHYGLKKYKKAVEDASKAIELNAKYKQAYQIRSKAYKKLGQQDLAEKDEMAVRTLN